MKILQTVVLSLLMTVLVLPAARAAEVFTVDAVHSVVGYKIGHNQVSNSYGVFTGISGTVSVDEAEPLNSKVNIEVKADSVNSYNADRDEHLKGPDFFNAKQFPVITFASTSAKKISDTEYEITGDLTLLGTTKSVTAKVAYLGTGTGRDGEALLGLEAKLNIKRSDFGMTYGIPMVGDEVELTIAIEATK
ncbi:MAG: YceI family protein [Candidatus Hydrogenedentes bacterium]|nr:YceI family protein [Candidatus Hydrogenedentota bacterium]